MLWCSFKLFMVHSAFYSPFPDVRFPAQGSRHWEATKRQFSNWNSFNWNCGRKIESIGNTSFEIHFVIVICYPAIQSDAYLWMCMVGTKFNTNCATAIETKTWMQHLLKSFGLWSILHCQFLSCFVGSLHARIPRFLAPLAPAAIENGGVRMEKKRKQRCLTSLSLPFSFSSSTARCIAVSAMLA